MKTYRVAVLGCRARGGAAGRAYAAHPRTELVALCDLEPERADQLGDELGVASRYTNLDRMMTEARPEIVAIPTGTEFHFPLCTRVLEYGAHIDVEKPMCVDLAQADALRDQVQAKGVRLSVHHQRRVGPMVRAMRRALEEGRIGTPHYMIANCKGYYGGLGLMNIGTHLINDFLALAGHCRSLVAFATTGGRPITPEDVVVSPLGMGIIAGEKITTTLQFDRNVTATLALHRYPKVDSHAFGFEVHGTEGRLLYRRNDVWWLPAPHYAPDGERDRWQSLSLDSPPGFDPASKADIDDFAYVDDFVRALDEGREPECGLTEGHHTLEIMMGILESAAYGRRIDLPQPHRDQPLLRWRRAAGLSDPTPGPRDYRAWLAAEDARISGRS